MENSIAVQRLMRLRPWFPITGLLVLMVLPGCNDGTGDDDDDDSPPFTFPSDDTPTPAASPTPGPSEAPSLVKAYPQRLDFGSVEVGSSSVEAVTLVNESDVTLTIGIAILPGGAGFSPRSPSVTLEAGESTQVKITFAPASAGQADATLTATSDAGDATVELEGRATGDTPPDADGDGFPAGEDCDDTDDKIYPGAPEQCDGIDNDCDDVLDNGEPTWYQDLDGDGHGTDADTVVACAPGPGYALTADDCDDQDATVHPDAEEACNAQDDDCDGEADEDLPQETVYLDQDQDGYGGEETTQGCGGAPGTAEANDDCDDADDSIYPGADEICDGRDSDCDGQIDEEGSTTYYADQDGDGHGDAGSPFQACGPDGGVANDDDCDDLSASIHPDAIEACNGIDEDCDSVVDDGVAKTWYQDDDADGFGTPAVSAQACDAPEGYVGNSVDCDDAAASSNPTADEVCDTKDNNCNGTVDEGVGTPYYADADGDDYGDSSETTKACAAPDGYTAQSGDCDDADPQTHPGATEICDGLDNSCEGAIDEGATLTFYRDGDGDGYGASSTTQACTAPDGYAAQDGDCDDAAASTYPGAKELCDGIDNDCDTEIDEGAKTTFYQDVDKDGYGDAASSVQACSAPTSGYVTNSTDCNDANAAVNPAATEVCNSRDDNCDQKVDEVDADQDGYTPTACGGLDCNDSDPDIHYGAIEVCDDIDNDCDGKLDESDPGIDFLNDSDNCGGCGIQCADTGGGSECHNGTCGTLPHHQHLFKNVTQVASSSNWVTLTGSPFQVTTSGGPLEIELSIPLQGGGKSSCRPIVDGKWAGSYEGLPETNAFHEGLESTGFNGGSNKRMWKRTRVYYGIPSGVHSVAVQCRTDALTLAAGRTGASALILTREYLSGNKVYQAVSLQGGTVGVSAAMVKVPGSDLVATTTSSKLEVTISLPIGNGGHAGCLEWMDGALIASSPGYANTHWYAGLEATYKGWIMWQHTRTYTGIAPGTHTFSIRCYNDSGTLNIGAADSASVIIVREIDESLYPATQTLDAYGNGWEISNGIDSRWYTLPNYSATLEVTRGNLEITEHLQYYNVKQGTWISCRPMIDGSWAGSYAGLSFTSNEEEGSVHELYEGTGWHGMWQRRRIYTNIPTGTHTVTVQCLSMESGYYVGHHVVGSLLVREVDLVPGG